MGFLKRLAGGSGSPPAWCANLTASQYAIFRNVVRSILGRDLSSDTELADPVYAEGYYGLVGLARLAGRMPDPVWSQGVSERLVQAKALKATGDAMEARSGTLEAALPNLRLTLCLASRCRRAISMCPPSFRAARMCSALTPGRRSGMFRTDWHSSGGPRSRSSSPWLKAWSLACHVTAHHGRRPAGRW